MFLYKLGVTCRCTKAVLLFTMLSQYYVLLLYFTSNKREKPKPKPWVAVVRACIVVCSMIVIFPIVVSLYTVTSCSSLHKHILYKHDIAMHCNVIALFDICTSCEHLFCPLSAFSWRSAPAGHCPSFFARFKVAICCKHYWQQFYTFQHLYSWFVLAIFLA